MDILKINTLISERKWTELLGQLPEGETTIGFPSINLLKSCKARAYDINSDKIGRRYTFKVDKSTVSAVITVSLV